MPTAIAPASPALSSSALLALAAANLGKTVEAHLYVGPAGVCRCTHLLSVGQDGVIWHEGIDGEGAETTAGRFLANYPDRSGRIWTVDAIA